MTSEHAFPVVGIGASAGGLEALQGLLRNLPEAPGLAFIIVTHRARGHDGALTDILARYTDMTVLDAEHDVPVRVNHVYVAPADHILTLSDGKLCLQVRNSEAQKKPIDVFLSTLAEDSGAAAVGILLSGGGSDGSLGMKAVKERGGFTLAQGTDGTSPQQPGMPDSAIASGVVDLVLPVDQMAERLADYARTFPIIESIATQEPGIEVRRAEAYKEIYRLLLNQVGHDFSGYKEKTFTRRILRRMQVCQITDLDDYLSRLRQSPEEVSLLFRDLLIGVTNFFRDPSAFQALEQQVIPQLFQDKHTNDTVRIWVPGCATGEEVYSIAILAREHLDTLKTQPKVQIFATDIDEAALAVARTGRYPGPLLENVSQARLQRFFESDDVSFAVNKELRELCVFSPHSVIRDPPFSRIDLISCRNLLIYLGTDFQAHIIPVFHFALRPKGFLFLGTSENVSHHHHLFSPVDKKSRIFQRRDHAVVQVHYPLFSAGGRTAAGAFHGRREDGAAVANLRRTTEARVMDKFAPAHVVVNADGDVLHYSGRTGKYLEAAAGSPNRQLMAMARRGLRLDLRAALREAAQTKRPAYREHVTIEFEDRAQLVNVTVDPFGGSDADPLFLVVFQDVGDHFTAAESSEKASDAGGNSVERLEHELRETRERLQATIEEYETAVEELKSSNEELQSINEELQSTNEELETSKEELQSVNEELHTVNAELNSKVEEVDRANGDLRNIFDSTQIATVFLDQHLVIRSFTPAVTAIFNLISSDRGRPLTDIVSHLKDGDLRRDIQGVLERGKPVERNVARSDGRAHYLMRILPYRGRNNHIEGVVVTFVDVTNIVIAEAHQRTLVEELNHRVRNMLTIVNAIATQTMKQSSSMESFAESFTGRVQAMGRSYGLVAQRNWGPVGLKDIIAGQLNGIAGRLGNVETGGNHRVKVEGPPIYFKPNSALALGLVVHELGTNALKYGALSNSHGHVRVDWGLDGAHGSDLRLSWSEHDGPAVKNPARKGFGSELVERELTHTLRATAEFDYSPSGLRVSILIPAEARIFGAQPQAGDGG